MPLSIIDGGCFDDEAVYGGGNFSGLGLWRYRTAITSTPNSGELQFDDATIDNATELYIHKINDTGTDVSALLNELSEGDIVYVQVQNDATQFVAAIIGTPTLSADVYTLPLLTVEAQGSAPSNNTLVAVVAGSGGIGGGGTTDHGLLIGLADDDHLQYLHKDITRHITVGYTTDVEADTFTDPLVPDFDLEYFKTMTVTAGFTLDVPTGGNGHGEYYLTVDSGGPYTLTAGSNVVMMDSNDEMLADENYILNIHRYSATNTVAQLLLVPTPAGWIIVENQSSPLATLATTLDFVGDGVVASGTGVEKTITISGTDADAIHDNVDAEISAITEKTTPVGADLLVIEDSAASNEKKRLTLTNLFGNIDANDPDAIHDNVANEIKAITDKPVPVSGDHYIIEDSADSDAKKSVEHSALETQFKQKIHFTVDTTSYTAAAFKIILVDDVTAGAAVTITLPAAASSTNEAYNIVKMGASYTVTVDGNSTETINGSETYPLNSQYDAVEVFCDGTEWVIL